MRTRLPPDVSGAGDTVVGIDVGGTKIRAVRVRCDGQVEARCSETVCSRRADFSAQLIRMVEAVGDDGCRAVGVGIPGRVDAATGEILSAGYLDVAGLDVRELIAERFGLPARIENDATMALIGEAHERAGGAGRMSGVLAMVTVGTGIGGAVLQDGRPWYGGGLAGQFGHLVVAEDGPLCTCGRRGCVETLSSGTALARLVAESGLEGRPSVEWLLERAATGDGTATRVIEAWARPFDRALQTLVAAIDPDVVIVGGGLGAAMVCAVERVRGEGAWFRAPVEAARLGDEAGAVGAGLSCVLETDA